MRFLIMILFAVSFCMADKKQEQIDSLKEEIKVLKEYIGILYNNQIQLNEQNVMLIEYLSRIEEKLAQKNMH